MHSVIGRASVEKGLEAAAREGRVEGGIEPPLNGCQLVRERGASGVIIRQGRCAASSWKWTASPTGLSALGGHHRQVRCAAWTAIVDRGFTRMEGVIEI